MQLKILENANIQRLMPLVLLAVVLLLGIMNFKKYGISWDEPMQRDMGLLCYDYVSGVSNEFFSIQNKYHNSTWELFNVLPEKWLNLTDGRSIYYSRHLLNFIIYWVGLVFLYRLGRLFTGDSWLACLGVLIFVLTPRIFAHGFYNSKDIPFLSFFLMSMYYAIRFVQKPGFPMLTPLLLASGAVFGMRILGIMIPFFMLLFAFFYGLSNRKVFAQWRWFLAYLLLYPLAVFILVPVLWPDPVFHFREAFSMMSHFPYDDPVLFQGEYIKPADLPWYYVPVWVGISVPLFWVFLFLSASIVSFYLLLFRRTRIKQLYSYFLLFLVWSWLPWLMVVLMGSHIYDEWRHLFFVYPAMIMLILGMLKFLFSLKLKWQIFFRTGFYIIFLWQSLVTLLFMVRNNPYQYVYFNPLAGKNIHLRYEMDYWGLSYRQAWEYLIYQYPESSVDVQFETPPGEYNLAWFTASELKKLHFVDYLSCRYFVTNYRFHPVYSHTEKIFTIKVDGLEIMTIFTVSHE